jgi:hypothetical protein
MEEYWMQLETARLLQCNGIQCPVTKGSREDGRVLCLVSIILEHGQRVEMQPGGYVVRYGTEVSYFENRETERALHKEQEKRFLPVMPASFEVTLNDTSAILVTGLLSEIFKTIDSTQIREGYHLSYAEPKHGRSMPEATAIAKEIIKKYS